MSPSTTDGWMGTRQTTGPLHRKMDSRVGSCTQVKRPSRPTRGGWQRSMPDMQDRAFQGRPTEKGRMGGPRRGGNHRSWGGNRVSVATRVERGEGSYGPYVAGTVINRPVQWPALHHQPRQRAAACGCRQRAYPPPLGQSGAGGDEAEAHGRAVEAEMVAHCC